MPTVKGLVKKIAVLRGLGRTFSVTLGIEGREETFYKRVNGGDNYALRSFLSTYFSRERRNKEIRVVYEETKLSFFDWLLDKLCFLTLGMPRRYKEIIEASAG